MIGECVCGGSCRTVIVACLDCSEKSEVEPSKAQAYHAGHAVILAHTGPRRREI